MRKIVSFILALLVSTMGICLIGEILYGQTLQRHIDRYVQSGLELSKGMFLVAGRNLVDPNFSQTVILLIDYSERGAVGLVINRPTKVGLDEVFPDLKGEGIRKSKVFRGGPVGVNELFFMILSEERPDESSHVFDKVYVSSNLELLEQIAMDDDGKDRFRVYAGYAGWAPNQLELEVSLDGWHVMHSDVESIFFKEPSDVWPELIYKSAAQWTKLDRLTIYDSL